MSEAHAMPMDLRKEDARLMQGRTRFTDDVHLDGMLHGVFIRSTQAHARIRSIDSSAALAAGALLVLTGADLPFTGRNFILRYANPNIRGGLPAFLAGDTVRFVGEPIAFLVARDRYVAEDLAALVDVRFESLPALATTGVAMADGAPRLHPDWENNVAARFDRRRGDPDRQLAGCERSITRRFRFGRQVPLPLETRGCVAQFDALQNTLCVWTSIQTHYSLRQNLGAMLDLPESAVRVIAEHVGGGFGSKSRPYPEDIVVSHASRLLGRPVKWIEDRFEHMQATTHSRDIETELTLGYDSAGRLLALKAQMLVDVGAYVFTSGIITAEVAAAMIVGPYRIEHASVDVVCVGTNKTPLATYRGAGQPEASFAMESLLDLVAKDLEMSPGALRAANIVRPQDFPYPNWVPGGATDGELESGDYPQMLARTVEESGYSREVEQLPGGERAAWGLACGLELTGFINFESARIRIEPTGAVRVWSGMSSQGQGQFTTYARVCADILGVSIDDVTVDLGDTDMLAFGRGAFGSRGAVMGANAVAGAAARMRARVLQHAAALLDCEPALLTIAGGVVARSDGQPGSVPLAEVAQAVGPAGRLFAGEPALEEQYVYDSKNKLTFALSIHAARVALDPRTGFARVLDYYVMHDAGRVLNGRVVEGQVVGAVAEGIGCTLLAEVLYDSDGQLQTGTLADYLVATAPEIPRIRLGHMSSIPTTNPLGVRGIGEGGVIAVAPAIVNALAHAIAPGRSGHEQPLFSLPVRPPMILDAVRRAADLQGQTNQTKEKT
ncbi:xanthine dehydrogenase family protein molybdopterin-binding subunit [Lacisediminimonas sp.]|uniref:xanthine dehydrogenase family protein molybdopterin-binding subunit n=1 Tax=Lacisediminimonas sp. TaxID=3060582 RepID=UPI00271BA57B|nr:xanthine dehydrogenase family protein molybdopterin-binding subunit [Lacisediminimonas sp.]MDO8300376.1 xanthine dehydrogenase family protein molybdopterin-binding subunit [Lacisediminimonas sp.]